MLSNCVMTLCLPGCACIVNGAWGYYYYKQNLLLWTQQYMHVWQYTGKNWTCNAVSVIWTNLFTLHMQSTYSTTTPCISTHTSGQHPQHSPIHQSYCNMTTWPSLCWLLMTVHTAVCPVTYLVLCCGALLWFLRAVYRKQSPSCTHIHRLNIELQ